MSRPLQIVCPWVTPKIFPDFSNPAPRVKAFFDTYAEMFAMADTVVVHFAAGNGDHVLNYEGKDGWDVGFEWARFNCYGSTNEGHHGHNLDWIKRVREGGEISYNPYGAGPFFIISEEKLNYRILAHFYDCFRQEAKARGINLKLLEYLEPGPEFCLCVWKTQRHPEGCTYSGIDVSKTLDADSHKYAAYPDGIPAGTNVGDFVATQTAAFVKDFGLDGIFLGNQFGLIGAWNPENAPEPTPERRAHIKHFFHKFRETMGDKLIYWMDTYWSADLEIEKWAMSEENYAQLDAVMMSNFAVITERTQIIPNLESKVRISKKYGNRPAVLFSVDFFDPWYWYRTFLDDRKNFLHQHDVYRAHGKKVQGISFFANDTFGHFVTEKPLSETVQALKDAHQA